MTSDPCGVGHPDEALAICNDCCTYTWCSRLGLCLSEAHADEHPEIQRVLPPGAVPVDNDTIGSLICGLRHRLQELQQVVEKLSALNQAAVPAAQDARQADAEEAAQCARAMRRYAEMDAFRDRGTFERAARMLEAASHPSRQEPPKEPTE